MRAMYYQGYFNFKKIIMLHPIDLRLPPLEGEVVTGGEQAQGPQGRTPPLFESRREYSLNLAKSSIRLTWVILWTWVTYLKIRCHRMTRSKVRGSPPTVSGVIEEKEEDYRFPIGLYGLRGCKIP